MRALDILAITMAISIIYILAGGTLPYDPCSHINETEIWEPTIGIDATVNTVAIIVTPNGTVTETYLPPTPPPAS